MRNYTHTFIHNRTRLLQQEALNQGKKAFAQQCNTVLDFHGLKSEKNKLFHSLLREAAKLNLR